MEVNMVKGLYGSEIHITKAVGYCRRKGCYLTCRTLKKHECLCKQCHFLDKHEEHEYWLQREKKKLLKKENKMNRRWH